MAKLPVFAPKDPTPYAYRSARLRRVATVIDGVLGVVFSHAKRSIPKNPSKIVVVKLDHLGDGFLFLPTLSCLRRPWPQSQITVICLAATQDLYRASGLAHDVLTLGGGDGRKNGVFHSLVSVITLWKLFRRLGPNLLVDPRGDSRTALAGFLARVPHRVGLAGQELFAPLYTIPYFGPGQGHETDKHRALLKALGLRGPRGWKPALVALPPQTRGRANATVLSVHATAGYPYKEWPLERYAQIIARWGLQGRTRQVHLLGSRRDLPILSKLRAQLPIPVRKNTTLFAGRLSIPQSYTHLATCTHFLGSDSVLAHFAAALGLPGVVLMNGAINQRQWAPLSNKMRVLHGFDAHHTCGLESCSSPCPHMLAIEIEDVTRALSVLK